MRAKNTNMTTVGGARGEVVQQAVNAAAALQALVGGVDDRVRV